MTNFNPLFDINVGPGGTFRKSGDEQTLPSDIDRLFDAIRASGKKKLVIHFHGGLNSEGAGIKIARNMTGLYQSAGAYPINIIWETGFWETVTRNLDSIGETRLFKKLMRYALNQVLKHLGENFGGRGGNANLTEEEFERIWQTGSISMIQTATGRGLASALTETEIDNTKTQIETDIEVELQSDGDLSSLMEEEAPFTELLDKDVVHQARDSKGFINYIALAIRLAKVVIRVLKRLKKGTDHGQYTTLVEEMLHEFYLADFGAWIWTGMKNSAENMFNPNEGNLNVDSHPGSYLLEHLAKFKASNPQSEIDLVGHSAGSIAICNLLKAAAQRHPEIKPRNILFMAAAVTSQIFHDELVTKPERFTNFRMYTMADSHESRDALFPPLYQRSLLYFISGVLEHETDIPLAGLVRHATGKKPYGAEYLIRIRDFLNEAGKIRLIQSVTDENAPLGERCTSTKHGGFDENSGTKESLVWIISS